MLVSKLLGMVPETYKQLPKSHLACKFLGAFEPPTPFPTQVFFIKIPETIKFKKTIFKHTGFPRKLALHNFF